MPALRSRSAAASALCSVRRRAGPLLPLRLRARPPALRPLRPPLRQIWAPPSAPAVRLSLSARSGRPLRPSAPVLRPAFHLHAAPALRSRSASARPSGRSARSGRPLRSAPLRPAAPAPSPRDRAGPPLRSALLPLRLYAGPPLRSAPPPRRPSAPAPRLRLRSRERIRASKDLMEAKQTLEENKRKRMMESRKADQEEEKQARERIRQRIEDDKAERRRRLGLPQEKPGASVPIVTPTKMKPVEPVVTSEQLRDCLRTLKKNHKDDSARVTRAFQILLKIIANIVKNPEEEKFRRIRLSNPVFKDRVGNLQGGVEFLELCGFQKLRDNGYLTMPRDKVDMALLNAAGVEIASAMTNPYFGLLSK